MKVTGFMGSPRKGGNTDILMDKLLEGAKERGAETQKIYLNDYKIGPCLGCMGCQKGDGTCVQKDDMVELYKILPETDIIVLGTPVYWYGPTAQMKLFLDRWFALLDTKDHTFLLEGKKVIIITPHEDKKYSVADPMIFMFEHSFKLVGMQFVGKVQAVANYKGDVLKDEGALQRAYQMGLSLPLS